MSIRRILLLSILVSLVSVIIITSTIAYLGYRDSWHASESASLSRAVREITLLLSLLQEPLGLQSQRSIDQWQAQHDDLTRTLEALPVIDEQSRSLKQRIIQENASINELFARLVSAGEGSIAQEVRQTIGGQLVVRTASMVSDVLAINDQTNATIYKERQWTRAVLAGTTAFLVGVIAVLLFTLHRRVAAPILGLTAATEALRAGRLDQPVEATGSEEVARLAASFEHMRVSLRDRLRDLAQANVRTEEAREEAERRASELDATLASLAEGLIFYNEEHQITRMNPAAEQMLGFTTDDVGEMPSAERTKLFTVRKTDGSVPKQEELVGWKALHGVTVKGEEFTVYPRGSEFPTYILSSAAPVRMADGRTLGAIQSLADITERRRAEEELEERVEERTRELQAANQELEAFSYSVSHDLRSPLRTIEGFSQIVLERYEGVVDERGRDYLRRIRAAVLRMDRLIEDILRLSRLSRASLMPETIDLSGLARSVVDGLREREPERRVEVEIAPDMTVFGDRELLRAALENLIGNAWKFTSRREDARIEIGALPGDKEDIFYIRDNGAGFNKAYADKLFKPFQRLHSEKEFPGTGIGLALVQRIVNRHGGHVRAESDIGQGATFYLYFPAKEKTIERTEDPARCEQ